MTPERWAEVNEVLHRAMGLTPERRAIFLDEACAADESLRNEVESILAACEQAGSDFLLQSPSDESSLESFLGQAIGTGALTPLATAPQSARIGRHLGPYELMEKIGEGGMGEVYRARRADNQYQKDVAIKLMRAGFDSRLTVARFKAERQVLANLDHPNITRLLDGGATEDGQPYLVMEHIQGLPLDEYCERHNLPVTARLELFRSVCTAVQYAHQNLIIHRDLKPGNILVTSDGVPKLLDFGIAKILDTEADTGRFEPTLTLFRVLTPRYASPEQIKGERITTASDVYSLGVVLYELLTGCSPYRVTSRSSEELVRAVCELEPDKPSTALRRAGKDSKRPEARPALIDVPDGSRDKRAKRLRGDLDNIVLMALRKEPQRRYPSAEQFAADIQRYLDHLPVIAHRGTVRYRASKFIARHKAGTLAAAAIAIVLIGALVVTLREAQVARRQAAIAQLERSRAQRRFDDVRKLANSLIFEVHESIRNLPGATPARKLIMDRAVQYLDSLAREAGGDTALKRELAAAYQRIGEVQGDPSQGNVGEADAALASMNKSAALLLEVAKANPNSPGDQLSAAIAHRLLASWSPQVEDQRIHMEQDLAIVGLLSKNGYSTPEVKNERSLALAAFGGVQDAEGDLLASVESYRQSLLVRRELAAGDPQHPRSTRMVATSALLLSAELTAVGSTKEALRFVDEAMSLYKSVLARENDVMASRNLAYSHSMRGDVLMKEGDYTGALASYRTALAMLKPMLNADPGNTMLHVDIGGNTVNVGKALAMQGRISAGLVHLENGIRVLKQQMKADPSNAREGVVDAYIWRGEALVKAGRVREAAASNREAIAVLEESTQIAQPYQPQRCPLAAPYIKLGDALARVGNTEEARRAYQKAIEVVAALKKGGAPTLGAAYLLADAYFGFGELSKQAAKHSRSHPDDQLRYWIEARDWYRKSQDIWRQIPNPGLMNPQGFRSGNASRTAAALFTSEQAIKRLIGRRSVVFDPRKTREKQTTGARSSETHRAAELGRTQAESLYLNNLEIHVRYLDSSSACEVGDPAVVR